MKVVRLTENDLSRIVKKIIKESNKNYINEQVTLLNIPSSNIIFGPGDNSKQIKLSGVDPNTKKTLVLRYNIEAEYGILGFDVNLRNIKRGQNGNLYAEAQPDSWAGKKALTSLIPKQNQTPDGWLYVGIPKSKVDAAIAQLRTNKGSTAKIDAGQGVKISLSLV